jgi:hypothetical protein
MCEHDFQLGADGEVRCIKCFVGDDEMELPVHKKLDEVTDAPSADYWATQVSFEE